MARSDLMRRTGFALPAVLAVTGVVTLIFLVAITALNSLNAETAAARSRVRFMQNALTMEASASYMATTEPFDPRSIRPGRVLSMDDDERALMALNPDSSPEVRLDGRPYRVDLGGPMTIRLQDESGLLNLALLDTEGFTRFVARIGGNAQTGRELYSRFLDYTDSDNLDQPNGAEVEGYGGGFIANRPLVRPSEWLSILGVREAIDGRRWRALRTSVVSERTAPTMNINTMTSDALQVTFGMTEQQAQSVIRLREPAALLSLDEASRATGVSIIGSGDLIYTFPDGRLVYEIRDARSAWVYRGRISLTPADLERPFWVDQTELFEAAGRTTSDTTDAPELPYSARSETAR